MRRKSPEITDIEVASLRLLVRDGGAQIDVAAKCAGVPRALARGYAAKVGWVHRLKRAAVVDAEGRSYCNGCGLWLPIAAFAVRGGGETTPRSWCRVCTNTAATKARKAKEALLEYEGAVHAALAQWSTHEGTLTPAQYTAWQLTDTLPSDV